ncbi:MAG: ABC transporter, partial [Clostridia bacterium]|nr:ABC transporter [Clostridia bacterium]
IIEIRNLIKTLGKNHTVILSTHILPEVQAVCDRIIIINKGKLVANEKTEDIGKVFEGTHRLNLKVCGPTSSVLSTIRGVAGVAYAEVLGSHDADSTSYLVESTPGVDIRKLLFNTLAAKGWPIIGIESMGASLEDIFISVVEEPDTTRKKRRRNRDADKKEA